MSAFAGSQKRTCALHKPMSALPPESGICSALKLLRQFSVRAVAQKRTPTLPVKVSQ